MRPADRQQRYHHHPGDCHGREQNAYTNSWAPDYRYEYHHQHLPGYGTRYDAAQVYSGSIAPGFPGYHAYYDPQGVCPQEEGSNDFLQSEYRGSQYPRQHSQDAPRSVAHTGFRGSHSQPRVWRYREQQDHQQGSVWRYREQQDHQQGNWRNTRRNREHQQGNWRNTQSNREHQQGNWRNTQRGKGTRGGGSSSSRLTGGDNNGGLDNCQETVTPSVAVPTRDNLYRAAVLHNDEEDWPHVTGTCLDMCPALERETRSRLRDLAVFERLDNDQSKTSKELAVKKFCRTFCGKELKRSDFRPSAVLCDTTRHLLQFLDKEDFPFDLIHDFLFDRTRGIRQDLSIQRFADEQAISITEKIIRFHIVSERELRLQRMCGKVFDSHLNLEQLSKSLVSLLRLYIMHATENTMLPNEAEFSCYYVLLNLGQTQRLALWMKGVKRIVLNAGAMQFARNVLRCYRMKNFYGFFRLARNATYLQSCLLELYFDEMRAFALNVINHGGYKLHPYPLRDLTSTLLLEEDDVEELCCLHGLAIGVGNAEELQLLVKQAEFAAPKKASRHYLCRVLQEKHPLSLQLACTSSSIL